MEEDEDEETKEEGGRGRRREAGSFLLSLSLTGPAIHHDDMVGIPGEGERGKERDGSGK